MLGEFATRLAVALPLVCLAAVLTLIAARRGWLSLPAFVIGQRSKNGGAAGGNAQPLAICCV